MPPSACAAWLPFLAAAALLAVLAPSALADSKAVEELQAFLDEGGTVATVADESFADTALSSEDAERAKQILWKRHAQEVRETRKQEMVAKVLKVGQAKMPFEVRVFGDAPATGRSLYISMHGGGSAPARVNDQQWENQKRLYAPKEGVYIAPRAPSDAWDLWHRRPVGKLFDRLIENLIVMMKVDPNRVYVMGYSAGGDGVYQLAPRMADRWAAAAMMAGHPNDASPLGLRNIGFILQVGGRDTPYKRNEIAAQWGKKLANLEKKDPDGYKHLVKIYPNKGHWMDREDAMALPWMAKFTRNPTPERVVWRQDDIPRDSFYWLAADKDQQKKKPTVRANRNGQTINLKLEKLKRVRVRLNDDMLDLDDEVTVKIDGAEVYRGTPQRTIATLAKTLAEKGDPNLMFSAEVEAKAGS